MPPRDDEAVEVVTVTPELAEQWLTRNIHNRTLRLRAVAAYAADMVEGHWRWNGESIKFSASGVLLDGQNRLHAVIRANIGVRMLVVRDLPDETQETMDGGVKRTFADVLKLREESSWVILASITRRVTLWEAGTRRSNTHGGFAPTNAQLLQTLEKYPWLREVASRTSHVASHCALSGSIIGLGMWLFDQIDAEDSDFFFARLGDGQSLVAGDPIYELRRAAENSRQVRGTRNETYLLAILIKTWNAYREGRQVAALKYRPGGASPERFPEPQ